VRKAFKNRSCLSCEVFRRSEFRRFQLFERKILSEVGAVLKAAFKRKQNQIYLIYVERSCFIKVNFLLLPLFQDKKGSGVWGKALLLNI